MGDVQPGGAKIRYIVELSDQTIDTCLFSISEIEKHNIPRFFSEHFDDYVRTLARDWFTSFQDGAGRDIFGCDICQLMDEQSGKMLVVVEFFAGVWITRELRADGATRPLNSNHTNLLILGNIWEDAELLPPAIDGEKNEVKPNA